MGKGLGELFSPQMERDAVSRWCEEGPEPKTTLTPSARHASLTGWE
jgi:hypothetical protein